MSSDGFLRIPRRLAQSNLPPDRIAAILWIVGEVSFAPRTVKGVSLAKGETPCIPASEFEKRYKWTRKQTRVFLEWLLSAKSVEQTGLRFRIGQIWKGPDSGPGLGPAKGPTYRVALAALNDGQGPDQGPGLGPDQGPSIKREEGLEEGKKKSTGRSAQVSRTKLDYSPVFLEAFALMPHRGGHNNPKAGAWRAWSARVREGVTEADLLEASRRYGEFCDATNLSGTQHAMQAATFYGPGRPFEQEWEIPMFNGNGKHDR